MIGKRTWDAGKRMIVLDNNVVTDYYLPMRPKAGNYVARKWWVDRGQVWTAIYRDGWFGTGPDGAWKTSMQNEEFNAIIEKLKSLKESEVNDAISLIEVLRAQSHEGGEY